MTDEQRQKVPEAVIAILSRRLAFVLLSVLLLTACAGGSVIVTGVPRPEIDSSQVKIYLAPPPHYTVIGIIDAHSRLGIYGGSQAHMNSAIEALKEQAASVGANGVLLTRQGGQYNYATLTGEAIYVPPN